MKKRILAVFLSVLMLLQASGCGMIYSAGKKVGNSIIGENSIIDEFKNGAADKDFGTDSDFYYEDAYGAVKTDEEDEKDNAGIRYQDDYYEYVNQNLLSKINLPATDAHWDWFGELGAIVREEMEDIIRSVSADGRTYEKGSSEQKIKDLYECVSNMENRDATGLGPLKPHMDSIRNAKNIDEYVDALAKLSGEFGFSSIVGGYYISQDKADSGKYAVYMMHADTLIGKEYIENDDTKEYVDMYFDYVNDMLVEFGMSADEAAASAASIEKILRDICASTLPQEQLYDPAITYNVFTVPELQKLYSNVNVPKMLKILRINGQDKYIVPDVEQAEKINSLLTEENLQALKDYSSFVMLNDVAEYASGAYAKLHDDMQNSLYGVSESWEDEKIWMLVTQKLLPWDIGEIYVKNHFSEEDKAKVEEMITFILREYESIIDRQDWMSDATKKKAKRKLETMQVKIGYPDEWPPEKDMMQVTPISEGGSLMSNWLVSMHAAIEAELLNLGKDVDRSKWSVSPQTINAMYDPLNNEIIFPAAIFQSPFYNSKNSNAANMGAIGFVIAHEISHAFDSNGAMYDEYGNYNVWWTDDEIDKFHSLSQSIVDYYSGYEMMGTKVNGDLTLMENIADLGAMTCITAIIGEDTDALDEAFGQFAYIWASEDTASFMMYILNTDTHSPSKIRVNAVLSSCDAFYDIYNITQDDKMYVAPENRVGIWK